MELTPESKKALENLLDTIKHLSNAEQVEIIDSWIAKLKEIQHPLYTIATFDF